MALQYMHAKGFAHNDVSLSNVVVVVEQNGRCQAVLVDLSIASPLYAELPGFVGSPLYAHKDAHRNQAWAPHPFHDMSALGFLAAILASQGRVQWRSYLSSPAASPDAGGCTAHPAAVKLTIASVMGHLEMGKFLQNKRASPNK